MSLAARRRLDAAQFKVLDATAISDPQNADEALAVFAAYAEEGDTLTLHTLECAANRDAALDCDCRAVAMTVGAKA